MPYDPSEVGNPRKTNKRREDEAGMEDDMAVAAPPMAASAPPGGFRFGKPFNDVERAKQAQALALKLRNR